MNVVYLIYLIVTVRVISVTPFAKRETICGIQDKSQITSMDVMFTYYMSSSLKIIIFLLCRSGIC
jgi:hypothetical protein